MLAEITNSGSRGYQQRAKVVKGGQFTHDFVWNASDLPDIPGNGAPSTLTMTQGDQVVLKYYIGDSTRYYLFPGIIESLKMTDDESKDVIRGTISGYVNGPVTIQ